MLTGTLNLSEIVQSQTNFPWIIFMPVGAVVFFITILAELEKPRDAPASDGGFLIGARHVCACQATPQTLSGTITLNV